MMGTDRLVQFNASKVKQVAFHHRPADFEPAHILMSDDTLKQAERLVGLNITGDVK